jgi:putative ABC transport system permease protein
MREWLTRLIDWMRRDRLDAELAEEMRFHREHLERDARAVGMEQGEARWSARRQLGNVTRVNEEARDRWSIPWLDHVQQDVRYALRGLRKAPGFTAAVVITLGLGIGANAAMFGVVDRLMFRPDPYLRDPGSVHRVYLQTTGRERTLTSVSFPYARYLDLKKWTTSFAQSAAFVQSRHAVGTGEATRIQKVLGVSAEFFDFFDARPASGRFFHPDEDALPAGANVAIVSFDYWKNELGAGDVIGRSLQVGNVAYTIVGVAPEKFVGVSEGRRPAVYIPITAYGANEGGGARIDYFERYNWDWTEMIVRRKQGVSAEAANLDMTNAFVRSRQAARVVHPNFLQVERASPRAIAGALRTGAGPEPGLESRTLLWISGVAAIVLLIACANVANLFLARALRRRREIALRLALGVSRGRLAASALTESLVLSLIGGAAGVITAQWGGVALQRIFNPLDPEFSVLTDWPTLAIAFAAALVSALLAGAVPAVFAGRENMAGTLKSGAREGTYQKSRVRVALLVTQGALSVALLVGAGLFVRSLSNVQQTRLGYDVSPLLFAEWDDRGTPLTPVTRRQLAERMHAAALRVPGVRSAAWATNTPLHGTSTTGLSVAGIDSIPLLGRFTHHAATPEYFETIGTRIVRGRAFNEQDGLLAPPVVVVSEAMAGALWPGKDPIGQCLRIAMPSARTPFRGNWSAVKADTMPCTSVIGVAENVLNSYERDYPHRYYLPEAQVMLGGSMLLVRMETDATAATEEVRRAVQAVMPGMAFVYVRPFSELMDQQQRSWRVGATMFLAFGVLALIVAAVGLYGVIAYNVAQRMHELGVRVALGAQRSDVMRLVIGQGVGFALAGVVVGSALALLAGRWIQPLLFRQSATDPLVFGIVGALLILTAVVASAVPAVRALRADASTVLRAE